MAEQPTQTPNVEVIVDGRSYSGWKTVDIDRNIEQLAGAFEMSVSEVAPNGDAATALRDGSKVTIRLYGKTVITGYIDDIEISHSPTDHSLTIRGRDATADLVDCSAMYKTGEWLNRKLDDIVKDLIKPFNIAVQITGDVGKPFAKWAHETGETVFENIDKLARHRGMLAMSDNVGTLLLTTPGTEVINTSLVLGENILSGQLTRSCQQRFSDYYYKGQRQRDDDWSAQPASWIVGSAKDAFMTRHRPYVCCAEDANASIDSLTKRAEWQAKVNAGRSQRVNITVQGWQHADGLWEPNKQVVVNNSLLRLKDATLLIAGVRYSLNEQGTRTELTLLPRDAFLVDKVPEEIAR